MGCGRANLTSPTYLDVIGNGDRPARLACRDVASRSFLAIISNANCLDSPARRANPRDKRNLVSAVSEIPRSSCVSVVTRQINDFRVGSRLRPAAHRTGEFEFFVANFRREFLSGRSAETFLGDLQLGALKLKARPFPFSAS